MVVWKDIIGFEGKYQISNDGRVRVVKTGKELTLNRFTKCGYRKAALYKNGKGHEKRIHRLVAEHFVHNPRMKETVNHIDGNKLNNHADNLEWSTRKEQLDHAYNTGLRSSRRGSDNSQSKLTDEQVREIRRDYVRQSTKFGTVALSKKYGVSNRVIGLIVNNKAYTNVD